MTRFIITTAAALFAGSALAGNTLGADVNADVGIDLSGQTDTEFSTLDANGDGMISQAEAEADSTASIRFNEVDENHDDMLTRAEFSAIASSSAEMEDETAE
ncbi:EF-hand domain-containing protein [Abyssibacter profundi]|uniref:EF-hand domain-containing protein n=1 Tax=Abyssibacter profundi TaxID=2182787 RepID=A0A363UJE6_9GAMM|nr:EF-hand domain-containing protein [Abyssibacter profundi]PWN55553.1 hypothetical protein DEH80_12240 [Abyssibacter profundi]